MCGPSEMQCSSGSGKSMIFPSVSTMQHEVRSQKEEKNWKNPVALRLLPETPSSKISTYQESGDESQSRLFGRDLGQREEGHCQIDNDDWSPKPATGVQSVNLSVWYLMYSSSPDLVMLLLESGPRAVLWSTPAYKKMAKASSSNVQHSHVFNPILLACFGCKSPYPGMVKSNGTLWGFTCPPIVKTSKHEFMKQWMQIYEKITR